MVWMKILFLSSSLSLSLSLFNVLTVVSLPGSCAVCVCVCVCVCEWDCCCDYTESVTKPKPERLRWDVPNHFLWQGWTVLPAGELQLLSPQQQRDTSVCVCVREREREREREGEGEGERALFKTLSGINTDLVRSSCPHGDQVPVPHFWWKWVSLWWTGELWTLTRPRWDWLQPTV